MNRIISSVKMLIDSKRIKVRETFNPYLAPFRRLKLKTTQVTIISNNCWGGHVYRYFGIKYQSPTVGLYFFCDDYLKFINNLKYYINFELRFIKHEESKYYKILEERGGNDAICPIGILDDVEIIFLHYGSEKEAFEKWTRRSKRIVWDNIVYKMSEQNKCTDKLLAEFDKLEEKRKFCFVTKDKGLKSQVLFKEYSDSDSVSNDTILFRKYIKLACFINGEPFKKKQ